MNARIRITMFSGSWDIQVQAAAIKAAGGIPSGKVFTLERSQATGVTEQVLIRPYYRRAIQNELHIFAVQVKPKEEV